MRPSVRPCGLRRNEHLLDRTCVLQEITSELYRIVNSTTWEVVTNHPRSAMSQ